jgi:hypothetical protein
MYEKVHSAVGAAIVQVVIFTTALPVQNALFPPDVQEKVVPFCSYVPVSFFSSHFTVAPGVLFRRNIDVSSTGFYQSYAGGIRSRCGVNGWLHGCGWWSDGGRGAKCGIRA